MKQNILSVIAVSLILLGCSEQTETIRPIEERITETKQEASQSIELPQISPIPTADEILDNKLFYLSQGRDPFRAMGRINIHDYFSGFQATEKVRMQHDPTRVIGYKRDPLENFELKVLAMVGTMHQADGELAALIDVGDNKIIVIHEGDYIGKDHGIFRRITEKGILIDEKYGAIVEGKLSEDLVISSPNEILLKAK